MSAHNKCSCQSKGEITGGRQLQCLGAGVAQAKASTARPVVGLRIPFQGYRYPGLKNPGVGRKSRFLYKKSRFFMLIVQKSLFFWWQ